MELIARCCNYGIQENNREAPTSPVESEPDRMPDMQAFASLQGQFEQATNHAVAGLKMIAAHTERQTVSAITNEVLLQIYLELRDQVCQANSEQFKIGGPGLVNRLLVAPKSTLTAEDLLAQVQLLSFQVLDLFEAAETFHQDYPWVRGSVAPLLLPAYQSAIGKHTEITNALASLEHQYQQIPTIKSNEARLALKVFLTSLHIDLQVFVNGEQSYDDYLNDNVAILDHAQSLLGLQTYPQTTDTNPKPARTQPPTPFVSCLGIIPLLFEIATRTTNIPLRDRALHLLHSTNRREGIWDRPRRRSPSRAFNFPHRGGQLDRRGKLQLLGQYHGGDDEHDAPPHFIITDIQLLSDRQAKVTYGFKRRWRRTIDDCKFGPAEGSTAFSAEEFHSFWLEGVGPGEGEVREEIIEFD
ncbi:uncharacterized protein AB675_199 [Cyphellophora attinorum]|uniref:Uncharacterized protein n=1 Tax=Cyphellophora attinorum TaxID=1664694 RepID=A0A0N1H156_9EURO|nr:uncharacterized protein AB675_199 [Phialophora attinorum]KPI37726.1 hypothetical protein AB675_199 [Phialophora attinorum]